jgi:ubiquinone/menaquinone biosynthesis C-methylase UbiE
LVEALAPRAGEPFLDLACGTGGVALVAARAGAAVVAVDISPDQLEKARAASAAAGLSIQFDEGDVQQLPYGDASFAKVASSFGIIFASDSKGAAAELTRVTRAGGRIAVTSWTDDDWAALGRSVGRESPAIQDAWAREDVVHELLGEAFELQFEEGEWRVIADSPEALWELLSTSAPRLKAFLERLDEQRHEEVRRRYVEFFGPGELRRTYVLTLGSRR